MVSFLLCSPYYLHKMNNKEEFCNSDNLRAFVSAYAL